MGGMRSGSVISGCCCRQLVVVLAGIKWRKCCTEEYSPRWRWSTPGPVGGRISHTASTVASFAERPCGIPCLHACRFSCSGRSRCDLFAHSDSDGDSLTGNRLIQSSPRGPLSTRLASRHFSDFALPLRFLRRRLHLSFGALSHQKIYCALPPQRRRETCRRNPKTGTGDLAGEQVILVPPKKSDEARTIDRPLHHVACALLSGAARIDFAFNCALKRAFRVANVTHPLSASDRGKGAT